MFPHDCFHRTLIIDFLLLKVTLLKYQTLFSCHGKKIMTGQLLIFTQ